MPPPLPIQDADLYFRLCLLVRTFYAWRDATFATLRVQAADAHWAQHAKKNTLRHWLGVVTQAAAERKADAAADLVYRHGVLGRVIQAWRTWAALKAKEVAAVQLFMERLQRRHLLQWALVVANAKAEQAVRMSRRREGGREGLGQVPPVV